MTIVVGVAAKGSVYIGADSVAGDGWCEELRADEKVFRNGPFVFGFTTSFRMGQLLRYALQPPAPPTGRNLARFMVTDFLDAVRQCLKDGGWSEESSKREKGGDFLVGVAGRLFGIYADYQVAQYADGYSAVGAGYLVALGSLHTTAGMRMSGRRRVQTALATAEHHTSGVRGPFTILSVRGG